MPEGIAPDPASVYFASGLRPHLMDGCDRTLYILATGLSADWAYSWFNAGSIVIALLAVPMWLTSRWGLQRLGKWDPRAVPVFLRGFLYGPFYSARRRLSLTARLYRVPKQWVGR